MNRLNSMARAVALTFAAAGTAAAPAMADTAGHRLCAARSSPTVTPVLELYTSEGCSSCPPADRWLSGLKEQARAGLVVPQAFHVGYWDYIGWVDRFAAPSHTTRQRQIAAANGLRSIYTPQLVRNGRDWRDYASAANPTAPPGQAAVSIELRAVGADEFEAKVVPVSDPSLRWSAYWTVTEHDHSSRVRAGENNGELLRHDFVVRQYVAVGQYSGGRTLRFTAIAGSKTHPRQVNLVLHRDDGQTLQALSLSCQGMGDGLK